MATPPHEIGTTRYTLVEQIKDVFIDTIRQAFSRHEIYKYVPNEKGAPDLENSEIIITDTYSTESKFLPAVVVQFAGGKNMPVAMNQNFGQHRANEEGVEFYKWNGGWDSNITAIVAAEDTVAREELASFVSMLFMHWKRLELIEKGVFIKSVSINGEYEEPYANDYIYFANVSIEIYTEWEARIPVEDPLESINYDVGLVGTLN